MAQYVVLAPLAMAAPCVHTITMTYWQLPGWLGWARCAPRRHLQVWAAAATHTMAVAVGLALGLHCATTAAVLYLRL